MPQPEANELMNRREFLRSLARYTILGGLLLTGGILLRRGSSLTGESTTQGAASDSSEQCRICPLLPTCDLPSALRVHRINPKMLRNCKF